MEGKGLIFKLSLRGRLPNKGYRYEVTLAASVVGMMV